MYLIEPMVFLAAAIIFDAIALEYKSLFFSILGIVVPLWELAQVAVYGYSNLIISSAYDANTASYHDLVMSNPLWLVIVLAIAVIAGSIISLSFSMREKV